MIRRGQPTAALLLICAVGLAAGMAMRAYSTDFPDRAQAAAAMFEDWCISRLHGETPVPGSPLVRIEPWPRATFWVDTETAIALVTTERSCAVNDQLSPMTRDERAVFLRQLPPQIAIWAPQLKEDMGDDLPPYQTKVWLSDHPYGDPQRWGISLILPQGDVPDLVSSLRLTLPADPDS